MPTALTKAQRAEEGADEPARIVRQPLESSEAVDFHLIELFFFAYREFTADADSILERIGFGRAHHRVLHFVNRDPGITITDLLDILQITKQSLARVLKQLVEDGYVCQVPGREDRRQRRLFPTEKSRTLTLELSRAQVRRIDAALGASICRSKEPISSFLLEMAIDRKAARAWFEKQGIGEGLRK